MKKNTKSKKNLKSGFALVTLIIFMVILTIVMSAAVIVIIANTKMSSNLNQSTIAQSIAESGVENALLRLLRDTSYDGENNLLIGSGKADITVTGFYPSYIIRSTGTYLNFKRTVQVNASYDVNTNKLIFSNWGETF